MSIPGPAAFARRCFALVARRPAAALAPFLHESYPDDPTLTEEGLTIAAGAGSFAIVALGTVLALACSAGYAACYALVRGAIRAGATARERVGR